MGGGGTNFPVYTRLMHNCINIVRGDTWLRGRCRNIEHLSRQPTNLAHPLALGRAQDGDLPTATPKRILTTWDPICSVIGSLDTVRQGSQRR